MPPLITPFLQLQYFGLHSGGFSASVFCRFCLEIVHFSLVIKVAVKLSFVSLYGEFFFSCFRPAALIQGPKRVRSRVYYYLRQS